MWSSNSSWLRLKARPKQLTTNLLLYFPEKKNFFKREESYTGNWIRSKSKCLRLEGKNVSPYIITMCIPLYGPIAADWMYHQMFRWILVVGWIKQSADNRISPNTHCHMSTPITHPPLSPHTLTWILHSGTQHCLNWNSPYSKFVKKSVSKQNRDKMFFLPTTQEVKMMIQSSVISLYCPGATWLLSQTPPMLALCSRNCVSV